MRTLILFVIVAAAIVGALLYGHQGDRGDAVEVKKPEAAVTVTAPKLSEYLVYVRPIDRGGFIRTADTKWVSMDPEKAIIPSFAVQRGNRSHKDFEGALVMNNADRDDFVNPEFLLLPRESSFIAYVLEPGKRAISIKIDDVTGSSGLIKPGDRVDLILFTNLHAAARGDDKSGFIARTILNDLRVIAIESKIAYQAVESGKEENGRSESGMRRRGIPTATLEVTPRQAELVTVSRSMGTLSLSLRSRFEPKNKAAQGASASAGVRAHDVVRELLPKEAKKAEKKAVRIIQFSGEERKLLAPKTTGDLEGNGER